MALSATLYGRLYPSVFTAVAACSPSNLPLPVISHTIIIPFRTFLSGTFLNVGQKQPLSQYLQLPPTLAAVPAVCRSQAAGRRANQPKPSNSLNTAPICPTMCTTFRVVITRVLLNTTFCRCHAGRELLQQSSVGISHSSHFFESCSVEENC
ncbi:hypothetical protein J6590_019795 [Homalodisca vitripennis]|nr:hypothetical protein J6590_019795 [Homalodisca vitripennis]